MRNFQWRYSTTGRSGGGGFGESVVTTLIIINVVIFIISLLLGQEFIRIFGLKRVSFIGSMLYTNCDICHFYPWQIVSYMFLHGGILHILFNMLLLHYLGRRLEQMWGSRKFVLFYLFCGAVAGIAHITAFPNVAVIGASGANMGILMMYLFFWPNERITLLLFFIIPISLTFKTLALVAVGIDLLFTLQGIGTSGSGGGIAHLAHLGGAFGGFIFFLLFTRERSWLKLPRLQLRQQRVFRRKPKDKSSSFRVLHPDGEDGKKKNGLSDKEYWEQIDKILDKISREGLRSLTRAEKRLLDEARNRKRPQ